MFERSIWKKILPWFLLSTYVVVLAVVLVNSQGVVDNVKWFISLFNPLIYGCAIAFVLNLPMKFIEKQLQKVIPEKSRIRKSVRVIALVLTIVLAFIVMFLLTVIVVPKIADSLGLVINNITLMIRNFINNIDSILGYFNVDVNLIDFKQVEEFLKMPWNEIIQKGMLFLGNSASGILSTTVAFGNTFMLWFAGFMFSLYILSSKETFARQSKKLLFAYLKKDHAFKVIEVGKLAHQIFSNFISGQMLEAVILGILYYIGLKLFNMPFAELISTLIAVTSLVPVFGPMFGMAIGAFLIFTLDPLKALGFVIFFQVLQEFENNFIYPRVVGNSVGLPGLWTLLSIFVFAGLLGVFGMLIAVPTTALIYTLLAAHVNKTLDEENIEINEDMVIFNSKDE